MFSLEHPGACLLASKSAAALLRCRTGVAGLGAFPSYQSCSSSAAPPEWSKDTYKCLLGAHMRRHQRESSFYPIIHMVRGLKCADYHMPVTLCLARGGWPWRTRCGALGPLWQPGALKKHLFFDSVFALVFGRLLERFWIYFETHGMTFFGFQKRSKKQSHFWKVLGSVSALDFHQFWESFFDTVL